jgi:serine/threonine protein kinase
VHRDIKLENLLMDSDRNMKIIDFGLAAIFAEGKPLKVHCGSPSYAAPEIIGRRSYSGPPVDVWSLGIVTFAMVCGHLPFYSRNGAPHVRLPWHSEYQRVNSIVALTNSSLALPVYGRVWLSE